MVNPRAGLVVSLIRIIALLLIGSPDTSVLAQKHVEKKVFVKLNSLPAPFTNDKLPPRPIEEAKNHRCYNLIGCYEKIPITALSQDPQDLKTEFRIYNSNGQEALVTIDRYEVCLEAKQSECDRYAFDLQQLLEAPFDPKRRTIVVIGGYFSKAPSNWEVNVKDLWSKLDDVNVIIVGWVGGNSGLYSTASVNTRPVARQLTVLLYYFAQLYGLDLNDEQFAGRIYMVGHSLGAHIAGFVGQDFGGRVGRITGLDPAGPQFDKLSRNFRLDRSDAQLVDIMHTNAGSTVFSINSQYGSALASGHVDFFANDGSHQPACSNDLLGCSHKKANAYYESYLNHELSMREYLKCENCKPYRLRAYASESYKEFHNGSGLKKKCPTTVLDDNDLLYSDLDQCSVPVDYVSWFDVLRDELRTKNGIDFSANENDAIANRYYYYTSENTDYQTDHYLLKVRMSKYESGVGTRSRSQAARSVGCDFQLYFEMTNGMKNKYVISKYEPIDEADHFEIIVPFLSPNFVSKYELAKLDENDFYLEDSKQSDEMSEKLRASFGKVLPTSIKITGLVSEENNDSGQGLQPKKKNSVMSFMKRLFGMGKDNEQVEDANKGKLVDPRCSLPIESFTVQPLRRIHRHLVAIYSPLGPAKPDMIVLKDANAKSPKLDLIQAASTAMVDEHSPSQLAQQKGATSSSEKNGLNELYLHTIIIGPYNSSLMDVGDERERHWKSKRSVDSNVQLVSPKTWLAVALSSSLMIILMVVISVITATKAKRDYDDKQALVLETQLTTLQSQ